MVGKAAVYQIDPMRKPHRGRKDKDTLIVVKLGDGKSVHVFAMPPYNHVGIR